jgi:Ion channel
MPTPERVLTFAYLRRTPSAVLLLVQLGAVLLYPWIEESPRGRAVIAAFGLIVLGLALRVVRRSPWASWLAFVLAVFVVLLSVIDAVAPHPGLPIAIAILEAAFYFYATGSLIAYMMQDWVATTDELFAAGATFTLLVWAFAYTYVACQAILPGSFSAPIDPQGTRTWMELLFLSVAVLSGVGLSDILPVTPFARALVMLEAFSGVMYIALVVSRLVALTVVAKKERG